MTIWRQWVRQPQRIWLRRAIFQVHLWAGVVLGLYVLVVCVTGGVLVYRNELYRAYSPKPIVVEGTGTPMSEDAIREAATRAYPGHTVREIRPGDSPAHAVEVTLERADRSIRRAFHPFTGTDLGDPVPFGYRATSWLLDLHDNLLAGDTGRRVNGFGALGLLLLSVTGAVIWWPGVTAWRRSLLLERRANWKRVTWSLHSVLGFWFFGFIVLWGVTGAYLSLPDTFTALFDAVEPMDEANPVERVVDRIAYWLAYLHFGRLGGRGIPGCGRGLCDSTTKAVWAAAAVAPTLMAVTGLVMWWNRVLAPALRRRSSGSRQGTPATADQG